MGYEVDFLAVGEESSGGDAIAVRYGNLHGSRAEQTVMVIDGGYTECGESLVNHIKTHYGTDHVDIVVSTHPDQDHVRGLEVVVQELSVGLLLMHQPWKHSESLAEARATGFSSAAVEEKLAKSLKEQSDLETIANDRGVTILEPFAGMAIKDGSFTILGPTEAFYEEILVGEQAKAGVLQGLAAALAKAAEAVTTVFESPEHETLRDGGVTSPQNNSSVVSLLQIDGRQILFTADAGEPALEQVLDRLESTSFVPGSINIVQVPHHGSRRNVGPSVLNRLLGPKGQSLTDALACVSAPKKNPKAKHPAKKVTNAFLRRGYQVHATQGMSLRYYDNAPDRPSWNAVATAIPFYSQVEEDSDA